MAGWRQTWRPLQLLVIFSLLILTNQTEKREKAEEKLNLRGTSQEELHISSPSLKNKELLHRDKVLDASLVGSDQQTMADRLQNTAEVCPCSTQEVLVPTRSSDPSDGNTRQENGSEPQQRLPVSRKLYNQTVCGSEPDQQNPQMDQVAHEADPVSRTPRASRTCRAAPSPDDPLVQFDQQQIVMLADDEVVRTAAASLFHKHPAVSSLHAVRPRHRVRQVKGQAAPLSERSSLVLVGHGAREPSGEMRISGYSYQDVARIIQSSSRIGQKIQTTAVVACGAGSDRRFPQALLQTLHRAGLETELHLWETAVQVAETGDVLSQDGARWRSGDHSKKLVLTVGRTGEIRRRDDRRNCTGQEVGSSDRGILGKGGKDGGKKKDKKKEENIKDNDNKLLYREKWPKGPATFIDARVYEKVAESVKVDQKHVENTFKILESLAWGFFYPEPSQKLKYLSDFNPAEFLIGERVKNGKEISFKWIEDNNRKENVLRRCYVIETGSDIRKIIHHFAKDGENADSYLLINDWLFMVQPDDLYVYSIGKKIEKDREAVQKQIAANNKAGQETYRIIKSHFSANAKKKFITYWTEFLQEKPSTLDLQDKEQHLEMFIIWYFTASVIAESARNFRTFPLTLMAVSMEDNRFWFNPKYITMADGGTWLNKPQRGFSGAAGGDLDKLAALLVREYRTISEWQDGGQDEKAQFTKMAEIAERYKIFQKKKEKNDFINKCIEFYSEINRKPQ